MNWCQNLLYIFILLNLPNLYEHSRTQSYGADNFQNKDKRYAIRLTTNPKHYTDLYTLANCSPNGCLYHLKLIELDIGLCIYKWSGSGDELKSGWLSVRPSVQAVNWVKISLWNLVHMFLGIVRRLVLQMGVIGSLPHQQNAINQKQINCHN